VGEIIAGWGGSWREPCVAAGRCELALWALGGRRRMAAWRRQAPRLGGVRRGRADADAKEEEKQEEEETVGWLQAWELVADGVVVTLSLFMFTTVVGGGLLYAAWRGAAGAFVPESVFSRAHPLHFFSVVVCWWVHRLRLGSPFAGSDAEVILRGMQLARTHDTGDGSSEGAPLIAADLGSGDGRVVRALAAAGYHVTGFENDPMLVLWSRFQLWRADLRAPQAAIRCRSMWAVDCSKFDVVWLYQWDQHMAALQAKLLQELSDGAIVVSNSFPFEDGHGFQEVAADEGYGLYIYRKTRSLVEVGSNPSMAEGCAS
jgi:hypothetical protein